MTPQFVVIVIVFASFLSTALGCFSVAGLCAFEVGLAQPATDVGRSAAEALAQVNEVTEITKAQSVESLLNLIPIRSFPAVLMSHLTQHDLLRAPRW